MTQAEEDTKRYHLWCSRIPGYAGMTKSAKKNKKKEWKMNLVEVTSSAPNFSVDNVLSSVRKALDLPDISPPHCFATIPNVANQKKEQAMYEYNKEHEATEHLEYRLDILWEDKVVDLQKTFGLRDDNPPSTPREIIDRITKGQYKVNADSMDREVWNPFGQIRWRDPARQEDYQGFEKARSTANAARVKTLDEIRILPSEKGLEALRAFESATFH